MKLIFRGVVQGVGFRPTLYRIATRLGLKGYVMNKGSEVEVVIDKRVNEFISEVIHSLPSIASITEIIKKPHKGEYQDFQILISKDGEHQSLIPTDVATCEYCRKEILTTTYRRSLFPFTNCTICGARYSVITDVPYDRERTSMRPFKLCSDCLKEYNSPEDRRYHAQTISCPRCGPKYYLYDAKKNQLEGEDAIKRFADFLDKGYIGVVKSWGGMHLCCKVEEIKRFREWYKRPQKPFAVMVKDISVANQFGESTEEEKKLLMSSSRPIVLVRKKSMEKVSPGINSIGLFLPYTGLHHVLFSFLNTNALVMTSANIPGEPMIIHDSDAFSLGADVYLLHNRDIPNRIDDSVLKFWKGHTFFLRKSRGYVPSQLPVNYQSSIIGVGADENITGSISSQGNIYCTPYIGNARYYASLEFLDESLRHLMKLVTKKPKVDAIGMDLHPGYGTRKIAKRFAEEFSAPIIEIQHDWAHAASLLIDNSLTESIVLTLEGLGYGTDQTFWGGEILRADFHSFDRLGHLEYIPLIGGDQATKDPRRLVFAIFQQIGQKKFFSGHEAAILEKLVDKSPKTCSLGRYLDALSCYLGICTERTYNGEPAMKLEPYLAHGQPKIPFESNIDNDVVSIIDLFRQLDDTISFPLTESKKADICRSFVESIIHNLTDIAVQKAKETSIENIGISGGVSYNIPIVEMIEKRVIQAGLKFHVHNMVPNGDGGISVGQNAIAGFHVQN